MSAVVEAISLKQLEDDVSGFSRIADYLRQETGINLTLTAKNQTLLASRMCKVMPAMGFKNYQELYAALVSGRDEIKSVFVSAITTNTTHFFREPQHFTVLTKLIREICASPEKRKSRELRIWCAACSSGEEPYSIAMVARNSLPPAENWTVHMLASDIDREILGKAARGVYSANSIESVPAEYRGMYFEQGTGKSSDFVRVRRTIRDMITFAPFNLMTPDYTFQNKFDIIFCRNVMIYFDKPEIQSTIKKLEGALRVGGFLFIGHSETIMGVSPSLKSRAAAVYERLPAKRKGEAA